MLRGLRMVNDAQLKANQENSKLGGVKTPEGKAVSKYNAQKHGILRSSITDYEQDFYPSILEELEADYQPQGVIEQILLERIAINYLKLFRVQKAETEFMKSKLHPRRTRTEGGITLPKYEDLVGKTIVIDEGYFPVVSNDSIQVIMDTYGRYETTIENRFYRSIHELVNIQKERKGQKVVQSLAVDINNLGSFSERGEENE